MVSQVSWYGAFHQGRPMGCTGKKFNKRDATIVASRDLRCGQKLRFRNPRNNRVAIAVVQDRGPVSRRLDFDLSWALANNLGIVKQGIATLEVDLIN